MDENGVGGDSVEWTLYNWIILFHAYCMPLYVDRYLFYTIFCLYVFYDNLIIIFIMT